MIIDIQDLINSTVDEKKIDCKFSKDYLDDGSEIVKYIAPIEIKGSFVLIGDIVNFDAKVCTKLLLTCSRCNDKFPYDVEIEIHEKFSSQKNLDLLNLEDEDINLFENNRIDIDNIIENNIIISLPIKRLCREDCKGLCPNCGTNLNYSSCNCKNEEIDPRMAKLKDFFRKS